MSGQRSISIPVSLYAQLLRLEGAARVAVKAQYTSEFNNARIALREVLDDLAKRDGKAAR